jgi:hypothetical protein
MHSQLDENNQKPVLIYERRNSTNYATSSRWKNNAICGFCMAIPMFVSTKASANKENNFNRKAISFELFIHIKSVQCSQLLRLLGATAVSPIGENNLNLMPE